MGLSNVSIQTSVDAFLELVKKHKKISIEKAAKELGVRSSVIQTWVDFLVDDKILGLEYQLVTPYVYLLSDRQKNPSDDSFDTKDEFYDKARSRNIDEQKIQKLWKDYVKNNLGTIHQNFKTKASLRGIPSQKIDEMWEKYKKTLE